MRSLVKYRQEFQIPPPAWRGPPKQEGPHISPQDSPIHIQLPQPVTDTYKLVYISHQARGDSDSGEHSPADSQGVDVHPGPALRKARSLEHLDVEAAGGPELGEHPLAKLSGTTLLGPAHSLKDSTALKQNPAHGGPDSRDRSTAHPSGLTILQILLKVTRLNKKVTTLQEHLQKHHLYLPAKVNLKGLKLN